jgi:hypothetical protein
VERPSDECPYSKPFPADFAECLAFQPRQFIPLDTLYRPLEPVLTCRHLVTRPQLQRFRWYSACSLGDAEARRRWALEVGPARLARVRELQARLGQVMMPYTASLWGLKGKQLAAIRENQQTTAITDQLRALAHEAMQAVEGFLAREEQAFEEVEMPIAAAGHLIQVAFERFIDTRFSSEISFEVPDDVLERFPEGVRSFFRPSTAPSQPSAV